MRDYRKFVACWESLGPSKVSLQGPQVLAWPLDSPWECFKWTHAGSPFLPIDVWSSGFWPLIYSFLREPERGRHLGSSTWAEAGRFCWHLVSGRALPLLFCFFLSWWGIFLKLLAQKGLSFRLVAIGCEWGPLRARFCRLRWSGYFWKLVGARRLGWRIQADS